MGIVDGTRIRLAKVGEAGLRGGPPGDLYIFISIKPHDLFQRDGADLYARVPIAMTTAALGGEFEVPILDGSRAKVKVPTLILWGRHDKLIDVSCVAVLENGIANSRSHIFEHVGHVPMIEDPAATARSVNAFLGGGLDEAAMRAAVTDGKTSRRGLNGEKML